MKTFLTYPNTQVWFWGGLATEAMKRQNVEAPNNNGLIAHFG